jgi:hypothetical protein
MGEIAFVSQADDEEYRKDHGTGDHGRLVFFLDNVTAH